MKAHIDTFKHSNVLKKFILPLSSEQPTGKTFEDIFSPILNIDANTAILNFLHYLTHTSSKIK